MGCRLFATVSQVSTGVGIRRLLGLFVIAAAVWACGDGGASDANNSGQGAEQNVILTASADKASYGAGEEVRLSLKLTNSDTAAVCLSDMATGNIRFTSLTRDGESVETRSTPSFFIASLSEILKSRLTLVASGEALELTLTSSFDPGLGAWALDTTVPEDSSAMATFYNVGEPGQYALELVYEYTGVPSTDCADVFSGPTNPVPVTFAVSE